jgi:hypothetical protein
MFKTVEARFFKAPASSKVSWHSCFEGGLAYHSCFVIDNMLKLYEALTLGVTDVVVPPKDSVILVGFAHDLGKIGDAENPYYFPQENEWRRTNLGERYTYNYDLVPMSVPQRALWWLQMYNVALTDLEYEAMIGHESDDKRFIYSSNPLLYLLKFADQWSALVQGI